MVGTTSILAEEGDPNKCPRCKGKVFEAEKMQSNRGIFHKNCFKCIDCQRALDPSLVFDGFQVSSFFFVTIDTSYCLVSLSVFLLIPTIFEGLDHTTIWKRLFTYLFQIY
jgi:hypothetical protein